MEQQEMHFAEAEHDGPQSSYTGYQGNAPYNTYASSIGQKLSLGRSNAFSAGQRLALAIVSLCLWVVVFIIVIVGISVSNFPLLPISVVLVSVLVIGLIMFTVLAFVINIMFNRK